MDVVKNAANGVGIGIGVVSSSMLLSTAVANADDGDVEDVTNKVHCDTLLQIPSSSSLSFQLLSL